ncbi:MAG TPA: nuclear transport factor 2 family protein [Polyangiaceae bacterium]
MSPHADHPAPDPGVVATIDRYNDAWNRHAVDDILALHTDDSVFENHTSGGIAVGKAEIRKLIEGVFATFPDLRFATRRAYFGESVAIVEWTATATHANPVRRGTRVLPPSGKQISWNGMDVLPVREGLVARKDVYADSISFLEQLGLSLP